MTLRATSDAIARDRAANGNHIENVAALRAFYDKLDDFSQSEEGAIVVSCYGDSVSPEVAYAFGDALAREFIGYVGTSSFSGQILANAIATPDSTEPSARWAGSGQPSYVLAGGATYSVQADGTTPDPVYIPKSDQHWVIPAGGSVTWTLAGANFRRALAFVVKESGAGSATVELLNAATDAVISTDSMGSMANATITADHADFTELDTSLGYKVRITASGGTVRALGVIGLQRRCVVFNLWDWGGSYLQQQNRSSDAIFNYINTVLPPAITFVETRGETPSEFAGAGIGGDATSGIANTCTRLAAIGGSKVLIGGKPATNAGNDNSQTALYRAAARANDFVFVDGVAMLKDAASVQALNWHKKNGVVDTIHLNFIASEFIAGQLLAQIPFGNVRYLWNCRDVVNTAVYSNAVGVRPNHKFDDATGYVSCLVPYGLNVALGKIQNVGAVTIQNPYSSATVTIDLYGQELQINHALDINHANGLQVQHTTLLTGRKTGWGVPTGTLTRTTFDPSTATLADVAQRLAALIYDMHASNNGNLRLLGA